MSVFCVHAHVVCDEYGLRFFVQKLQERQQTCNVWKVKEVEQGDERWSDVENDGIVEMVTVSWELNAGAWGDHIAVQGLAHVLHIDIHIISTINPDMDLIKTFHSTFVHLGLIGQFHYQALERCHPGSNSSDSQTDCTNQEQAGNEDQEAFKHQAQLWGFPYDCCLLREDTADTTPGRIVAVAPGEGQKPISILTDQHFEEMCNRTKYPTGRFGLITERKTKLTTHKYFNQRLLDADEKFSRVIEYLLTAQYALEAGPPQTLPDH